METATPANGRVERAQGVQFYSIQMSGQKTRQIVQSAENNQGSQILLDTNRRIYSIQINGIMLIAARFSRDHALAPGFELVAPAFIFVPRKLTAPRSSNRNNTSFKNVRNPLSPNKKAFSNRNSKPLFRDSQPPSVKLPRITPAWVSVISSGTAGLQSRRKRLGLRGALAPEAGGSALRSERRPRAMPIAAVPQFPEISARGTNYE